MPKDRGGSSEDREIGRKLRTARLAAGLTQLQVGEALDRTFQQIQKYEKGITRLTVADLQRICPLLHVPVSYFMPTSPEGVSFDTVMPVGLEDPMLAEVSELVEAYCRISNGELRRSVLALAIDIGRATSSQARPKAPSVDAATRQALAPRSVESSR